MEEECVGGGVSVRGWVVGGESGEGGGGTER